MACLFDNKPLSEWMQAYCELDPWQQTCEISIKLELFSVKKIQMYRLQNDDCFVFASFYNRKYSCISFIFGTLINSTMDMTHSDYALTYCDFLCPVRLKICELFCL